MENKSSKSKDKSLCQSSERLIDRIFHRFKLIKRNSSSNIMNETPIAHSNIEYDSRITISRPTAEDDQRSEQEFPRITPNDLQPFAEQLGKFLQYVQGIQELSYSIYEYPCELQVRLEKDTNELDGIYREVKAASMNVQRIKQQRKSVSKEISSAKKTLHKLRNDETRELEALLQIYDKPMFIRWENLKNTRKPDLLKSLQSDLHAKQEALEGLSRMISNKLANQHSYAPLFEFGSVSSRDKSQSSEPAFSPRRGLIGPQRPYRRRKVPEDQSGANMEKIEFGPAQEVTTITVAPLPPPLLTVTPASSTSDRSLDTSSSSSLTAVTPTASDSNTQATTGFASEMHSVLQALFGGSRREDVSVNIIETITIDDSPSGSISSNNDNSDESNAVQLFSMNGPDSEPNN